MGESGTTFRHEAVLYDGIDGFMSAVVPFLRDGIAAGEPGLVAVDAEKIRLLRAALEPDADGVRFVEMREMGRNPARIIPVWRDFVADNAGGGRPLRGIGEPVWAGRSRDEMAECECHESLLNVAFDHGPGWQLLCPYDTASLDDGAIDVAHRTHPWVTEEGVTVRSREYADPGTGVAALGGDLPLAPVDADEIAFTADDLPGLRWIVADSAKRAGLEQSRVADLVLAVHELATNSLRYGGGSGVLRIWQAGDKFLCEVHDEGRIEQPLVGRQLPGPGDLGGHGLWLVNQTCDLVQVRSSDAGNVVRVHMAVA